MEQKNYDTLKHLIIPLLDDNITQEDVSDNSGFIGIYTEDKNRPYLDNHIFLMYDSQKNTLESMNRFAKFSKLDTIYNRRYVKINGEHRIVYAFTRVNNSNIRSILNSGLSRNVKDSLNIYNFWNKNLPEDLILRIFHNDVNNIGKLSSVLPEEDYYPKISHSLYG